MTASPVFRAALWMSGAIVSFISMAIAGRAVSLEMDTFEIMTYRSLTGILIVTGIAFATGRLGEIRTDRLGLHAIRNLAHFTGQNLWFYALTVIPLAQVFSLEFTTPIWVIALSPLLLGERLTPRKGLVALIGFAGVLIVARPSPETLNAGVIAAAASAIGFAVTAIVTRKLTQSQSVTCILFYLTLMQAVFGLVTAGWDGDIARPTWASAPWLVLIGCAGLLAHFCLTTALRLAPASVVMPIDFVRLPLIVIVGAVLYAEPADPWVLAGAALILGANWLNLRSPR